jgi:hypothetical protein
MVRMNVIEGPTLLNRYAAGLYLDRGLPVEVKDDNVLAVGTDHTFMLWTR